MSELGEFFGIGVGPGEPGMISVAAWEQLKLCDVIYVPRARSAKHSVARQCLPTQEIPIERFREIEFTMNPDRTVLSGHYAALAASIAADLKAGHRVAYLTLGDAFTYSTYSYTLSAIKDLLPGLIHRTFPGITSYGALAAATAFSLGEGKESVLILPCPEQLDELRAAIQNHDVVVLMKIGRRLPGVLQLLREMAIQDYCVFGRRLGLADELVCTTLADLEPSEKNGYLSTMLIRKTLPAKRHIRDSS